MTGKSDKSHGGQPMSVQSVQSMGKEEGTEGASNQCADDAKDYVESIMSSQRLTKVHSPKITGRKRHASVGAVTDLSAKKVKGNRSTVNCGSCGYCDDCDNKGDAHGVGESDEEFENSQINSENVQSEQNRRKLNIRRTLCKQGDQGKVKDREIIVTEADVHMDSDPSVKQMISKLSADVHMMFTSLSDRIDKLEAGLEQRISHKVAQLLDKRVNAELGRIKKEVDTRLDSFKDEIMEDMDEKLSGIQITQSCDHTDISLNVAIRNLRETVNENLNGKVDTLIKDALKVRDVKVIATERKGTENRNNPGVVIARFRSSEDKKKVMLAKNKLKDNRQYPNVFIHHDQSREERLMASNLRKLVNAVKGGDTDISVRGSRVIQGRSSSGTDTDNDIIENRPERSFAQATRATPRRNDRGQNTIEGGYNRDRSFESDRPQRGRGGGRSQRGNSRRGNPRGRRDY